MLKARVFRPQNAKLNEEDLKQLLEEAGCVEVVDEQLGKDDKEETVVDDQYEAPGDAEEITLIVILTPDCIASPDLNDAVGRAIGGGGRAIGVWPKGTKTGQVPDILGKVGSGIVVWDPKELASVLTDTETVWDTPDGDQRPAPITKRNKC